MWLYGEVDTRYALVKGEGIIFLYQPLPLFVGVRSHGTEIEFSYFFEPRVCGRYSGPVRQPYTRTLMIPARLQYSIQLVGNKSKAPTQISSSSSAVLGVDRR